MDLQHCWHRAHQQRDCRQSCRSCCEFPAFSDFSGRIFNEMWHDNSETCGMTTLNHQSQYGHSMAAKSAGPLKVIMLGQLRQKLPCRLELHSIGFAALLMSQRQD